MRGMGLSARWGAAIGAAAIVGSLLTPAAVASDAGTPAIVKTPSTLTTTSKKLAPGIVLKTIHDPSGPYIVHELVIDPTKALSIDVVTAGTEMGYWARTSTMGANAGAIAAINGDFSVWPGRPQHPFVEDGQLKQTGLHTGSTFGERRDEARGYIRHEKFTVRVKNPVMHTAVKLGGWNTGDPGPNSIHGYSPYGGMEEQPPSGGCAVRMAPDGKLRWGAKKFGLFRRYRVLASRCGNRRMAVKPGTVVLAARGSGDGGKFLRGVKPKQMLRLRFWNGMKDVMDLMGGAPLLVHHHTVNADPNCHTWFCSRNPRTGVGVTHAGKVMWVTVDGRSRNSVGMTIYGFAKYMLSLGADEAVNLDGGGSSTMWVKGQGIVNDPSDGAGERPLTNALVILPGADVGENEPLSYKMGAALTAGRDGSIAVSPSAARRAMNLALADPGSTGGLMDWLVSSLGASARRLLPHGSLAMARSFRRSVH